MGTKNTMTITFSQLGTWGRLGNQLFQIATVIAAAHRNNDTYLLPSWQYEKYFQLHNCFSNNIRSTLIYREPFFQYQRIPGNTQHQILDLAGYFQSWRYFDELAPTLRQLFTSIYNIPVQLDTTSLHVRRGDYIRQPHNHTNLGMDYYRQAMKKTQTSRYLIFSDDIAWCKTNFVGSQFIFSEGKNEVEDLTSMTKCSHHIIANSSFSWWGAYLNNQASMVIAPYQWFGPALAHNTLDLLPQHWIIL
jgi:hypothetical protein